jgi:uncharacterized iron-regulated membrane protein
MARRKTRRDKAGLREFAFRLHSWLGIGAVVYLACMAATGSILVFYPQLYSALSPHPSVSSDLPTLTDEQLREIFAKTRPGDEVNWIWARPASGVVEVRLSHANRGISRLINAFTGEDLGPAYPVTVKALNLTKRFHQDLFLGTAGRVVNLTGGLILAALALTGAAIWWPGKHRWRRHLVVRPHSRGRRLVWEAHSAVGFWFMPFQLMWGITGLLILLNSMGISSNEPGWLDVAYSLHFGTSLPRFLVGVWSVAALTVPLLAITGAGMLRARSAKDRRPRHYSAVSEG